MKHTYTAKAYIDPKYESLESVKKGTTRPRLATSGFGTYYVEQGYTHVGDAEVRLALFDEKTIHANQLDGLKTQLKTVRAENKMRENAILDQISKLQALTFVESA